MERGDDDSIRAPRAEHERQDGFLMPGVIELYVQSDLTPGGLEKGLEWRPCGGPFGCGPVARFDPLARSGLLGGDDRLPYRARPNGEGHRLRPPPGELSDAGDEVTVREEGAPATGDDDRKHEALCAPLPHAPIFPETTRLRVDRSREIAHRPRSVR